jgi:hypothetical protein
MRNALIIAWYAHRLLYMLTQLAWIINVMSNTTD